MRIIKSALLLICFLGLRPAIGQIHTPLPHGMVFGVKPRGIAPVPAERIEALMGKKNRQTTAITGKILKVTREQGGWFELDAGAGKVIAAHFKNYNIKLPMAIAGRTVIVEGVAQRLLNPDDLQHFAGDTVTGTKEHQQKTDPNHRITFEVRGLVVDI